MNPFIIPKLLELITDTQMKTHQCIIHKENDEFNKIIQLQSGYLTITNDFSNSYHKITLTDKLPNDINEQITQYLAKIKHDYTNKDISTIDRYVVELTKFHEKLNHFGSLLNSPNIFSTS